jgi:hypothetical protein
MMSHPSSRGAAACRALILLATLALASAGREARATDLTTSNLLPTETSPPYATVTLTQKATNVVEFTVTATTNWYSSEGPNFGITNFTFDSDLTLSPGDITFVSPSVGWSKVQNPPANPFGSFNWGVTSTRGTTTLVFDVTHAGATPSDFSIYNLKHAMFAANIVNFTVQGSSVTSHWVTNGGAVQTIVMVGIGAAVGLGLLGAWFVVRHKKAKRLESKGLQDATPS